MLNAIFSIWTWLMVALCTILCCTFQALLVPLTWPWDRRKLITGRTLRLVAGVMPTVLTPLWSFGVFGKPPRKLPPRAVVVSNHESQADPFLMSRLPWEMKWLGKASLFKIPVAGWAMWLAGDVPLHRGDSDSARGAMDLCRQKIESGVPVMIFPEGTRSKTGEMLPFKSGAFRLAIQTGADIVPVAVYGTRKALPKHSWRVGKARALVTVGEPISTRGMTQDDVGKLLDLTRARITELRATLAREIDGA